MKDGNVRPDSSLFEIELAELMHSYQLSPQEVIEILVATEEYVSLDGENDCQHRKPVAANASG